MLFSVLIPIYNVEKYLLKCLESIKQQEFKDYEVILVDDGSKDNSGKMCDEYCKENTRFRVIHKENRGLISARRVAIQNAKGEYCIFCDSDDFFEDNAFQQLYYVIKNNKPDMIIYNAYKYEHENKEIFFENVFETGFIDSKEKIYDKLLLEYTINSLCLKAVRKSVIDTEADYTNFYACNFGEDLLQTIPLIKKSERIYYLDKCLYNYRVTGGMMHTYNKRYYWSYRTVNEHVLKEIQKEGINDLNCKLACNLLIAAYGAATQLKYCKKIDNNELEKMREDDLFKKKYSLVRNSRYWHFFSRKEKLVLRLIYNRRYRSLYILLKIKNSLFGD